MVKRRMTWNGQLESCGLIDIPAKQDADLKTGYQYKRFCMKNSPEIFLFIAQISSVVTGSI